MRPPTRRTLSSLPVILAIIALLLSALYVAGLVFDWPAWLRGSNWVWVRRVPELAGRLWLMAAALAVGLALGAAAVRGGAWSRRRTALFLGGLVVLAPLLQLAVAAQHRAQPLSLVVLSATGFWQEGARIEDPLLFAREHAARMPTYADVHVRTQPPGWPLAYWAAARGLARFPAAADWLGGQVRRYDCVSPEFAGLSAAQTAAGLLRVVILVISGIGAPLLYAISRRYTGNKSARLAAVGTGYLPALLVFSGRFDVAYALLALVAVWLALRAVADGRRGSAAALAVVVAVGSFFTFTVAAIAAVALLVAVGAAVGQSGWRDRGVWRRAVGTGGAVVAAVLLFWGGLWLLGVDGLAMWRVGQAIHREYRLNYPAWFLFNLYDLAVFMGIMPFVGAVGVLLTWRPPSTDRRPPANWRALALGWWAAVLLLNLSATVRAETGRLWLFLMPLGLLIGLTWFAERLLFSPAPPLPRSPAPTPPNTLSPSLSQEARGSASSLATLLWAAYLIQALTMGYFLGGRAGEPATPPPQWDVPGDAQTVAYQLGDAVALRGYRVAAAAGGTQLTLYWQALDFPRAEYSAFVHALDATGQTIAQSDGPPAAVPMWCWVPGEVVADERQLVTDAPPASFAVGLYDALSGQRLPVQPPAPDDRIVLPGAE